MNWFAVYTKPKSESNVTELLRGAGIEVLGPKLIIKRLRGGRVAELEEPFFPCYIFSRFDPVEKLKLVSYTRGVRYVLGLGQPIPVPDYLIAALKGRMDGEYVRIEPPEFRTGQEIIIGQGLFKGVSGIFERYTHSSERVLVLLKEMGWKLEVESWQVSAGKALGVEIRI